MKSARPVVPDLSGVRTDRTDVRLDAAWFTEVLAVKKHCKGSNYVGISHVIFLVVQFSSPSHTRFLFHGRFCLFGGEVKAVPIPWPLKDKRNFIELLL